MRFLGRCIRSWLSDGICNRYRSAGDDQIKRHGGATGVRDFGLLEAALFRPQTGYYGDLVAEASALWASLSLNHAFVDGNKRTAFAVTYTFLVVGRLN
jgi:death-on-curing protein